MRLITLYNVKFRGVRTEAECKAMWSNCLRKGLARKAWTKEETDQLIVRFDF